MLGVDLLVCRVFGHRSLLLTIGSDSPSNSAALVSWSSDDSRFCEMLYGKVRMISGMLGLCRACLVEEPAVAVRCVLSDMFETEPWLVLVAVSKLGVDPRCEVSNKKPV